MGTVSIDFTPVVLAKNRNSRKVVQRLTSSIIKRAGLTDAKPRRIFSLKSMKDVGEIYELAAYLFVFGDYDMCYAVCGMLDEVCFCGDYNIWDPVSRCRTMQVAIDRMNGNEDKASQVLNTILPYEAPDLYGNAWNYIYRTGLELKTLYDEAKAGLRTPRIVRKMMVGVAMACNHYAQLGALPEHHDLMKKWHNEIVQFLCIEEK